MTLSGPVVALVQYTLPLSLSHTHEGMQDSVCLTPDFPKRIKTHPPSSRPTIYFPLTEKRYVPYCSYSLLDLSGLAYTYYTKCTLGNQQTFSVPAPDTFPYIPPGCHLKMVKVLYPTNSFNALPHSRTMRHGNVSVHVMYKYLRFLQVLSCESIVVSTTNFP